MPEISVVVPVYNTEKWVARCINSILNQSFKDFELILVNDGSPDHSLDILMNFAKVDKRIRIINNEINKGLMTARRIGYLQANGRYTVFCDSDDYLPTDSLQILYQAICLEKVSIVLASWIYITSAGKKIIRNRNILGKTPSDVHKALLKGTVSWSLCAAIYCTDLLKNYHYESFDHLINLEDRILLLQLLKNAESVLTLPEIVYFYCQNNESSSRKRLSEAGLDRLLFAYDWCYNFLLNHNIHQELATCHYLRSMAYYIEQGYNKRRIVNYNARSRGLYTFRMLCQYCGIRYACYAMGVFYSVIFRKCCQWGRSVLRFMLGRA